METETPSAATLVQPEETILLQCFIFSSLAPLSYKYIFSSLQCLSARKIQPHTETQAIGQLAETSHCVDGLQLNSSLSPACGPPHRLQLVGMTSGQGMMQPSSLQVSVAACSARGFLAVMFSRKPCTSDQSPVCCYMALHLALSSTGQQCRTLMLDTFKLFKLLWFLFRSLLSSKPVAWKQDIFFLLSQPQMYRSKLPKFCVPLSHYSSVASVPTLLKSH